MPEQAPISSAMGETGATASRRADAGARLPRGAALSGLPPFEILDNLQGMAALALRTLRVAARPPFPWVRDAVAEVSTGFRRCVGPVAISVFLYTLGFGILQFAVVGTSLGISDRQPGVIFTVFIREINLWISAMILAGIVGSSIAADLGARKIRDELDALDVLAVDRFVALVVPRVVAMTVLGACLPLLAGIVVTTENQLLSPGLLRTTPQGMIENLQLGILPVDVYAAVVKGALVGFFLGVVACHVGLRSKGGAEGVGRAVTTTVVISFFGVWTINTFYNLAFLTMFPEVLGVKG